MFLEEKKVGGKNFAKHKIAKTNDTPNLKLGTHENYKSPTKYTPPHHAWKIRFH